MALRAGGCGETGNPDTNTGGNAALNNVVTSVTPDNDAGIWVSRVGTMTGRSITAAGANSQGVHADATGTPALNNIPIIMRGTNSLGAFAGCALRVNVAETEGIAVTYATVARKRSW